MLGRDAAPARLAAEAMRPKLSIRTGRNPGRIVRPAASGGRSRGGCGGTGERTAMHADRLVANDGDPSDGGSLPASDTLEHYRRPRERSSVRGRRDQVTVLFGGLTRRHEALIEAAIEGLGYKVRALPTPTKADCQTGKEYCNPGQCNPSYFTVGALINYLKRLRDEHGLTPSEIAERYVYMTAGSCGPCRFGMYESEYRTALENAGFGGFEVLVFQQGGGLKQAAPSPVIEFNVPFFLAMLNAMFIGDILNFLACRIRPFEIVPGRTDEVLEKCLEFCKRRLREKSYKIRPGATARLISHFTAGYGPPDVAVFLDQLRSDWYADALSHCAGLLDEQVEVDYTRPKPRVKIVGEFWAQTTEGDGNFRMFEFLEQEGAEVLPDSIAGWVCYILHQAMLVRRDRKGLPEDMQIRERWPLADRVATYKQYYKKMFLMWLARWMIHHEYDRLRRPFRAAVPALIDQTELRKLAEPYYNVRAAGGEGHLEVAKTIYYSRNRLCHMVLSLKPFGCMPSTQSDGAQVAVMADYPEVIFLPIETNPEGEVNAYSRVQMALGEAKARCKSEFARALVEAGVSLAQVRDYVAQHRDLRRPLQPIPKHEAFAGSAANFVLYVARRMQKDPSWRRKVRRAAASRPRLEDLDAAGRAAWT